MLKPYRNKRTLELLWQGVWGYVREHGGSAMIGCGSFPGTDPSLHAQALSYLHHVKLAPAEWRVRAHDRLRVDMNMLPKDAINARAAIRALPPLIKGYLRVGAYVGDGAVIDHQFGTTDVFLVMPVEAMNTRIFNHFGAPDELPTPVRAGLRRAELGDMCVKDRRLWGLTACSRTPRFPPSCGIPTSTMPCAPCRRRAQG